MQFRSFRLAREILGANLEIYLEKTFYSSFLLIFFRSSQKILHF